MGKITIINAKQKLLLNEFSKNQLLSNNFYFTGGTALSLFYLKHRVSVDLDFFSPKLFDNKILVEEVTLWAEKYRCSLQHIPIENTNIFNFRFPSGDNVKMDFSLYAKKQIEEPKIIKGIKVDSLIDIAVNKLFTIEQRTAVKDFVDLYFLLKKFTIWDLIEGVRIKYQIEYEPTVLGSDLMKVEEFEYLPKMIKPLTLETLKSFFRQKAKELGMKSVEP